MKPYIRFSVLAFLSLTLISSAFANTYYVDGVNGSDNNNCQSATFACKTITHAINLAVSGDTIMVAPATYGGPIVVATNVSIVGAGAANTIITGSGNQEAVVLIPSKSPELVVSLSGVTIQDGVATNFSTTGGTGVLNYGKLTIANSVITRNAAVLAWGGGITNHGLLTINKTTISGNTAQDQGGGIACSSLTSPSMVSMNINNSTIEGNFGGTQGGGIYTQGCPTTIINSTITGNSTSLNLEGDGVGGGIYSFSTVFINNTTISGNSSPTAGGIYVFPKTTTKIQNSILANNAAAGSDGNCFPPESVTSDGYNISSDTSCSFSSLGDMNSTNPMLGPLQNNGGPTMTMEVSSGSPGIDAGNPTGCTDGHGHLLVNDQRGDKRPGDPSLKTGCDIGAYEYQFPK
jgi:predicted outer membrane repeat protein